MRLSHPCAAQASAGRLTGSVKAEDADVENTLKWVAEKELLLRSVTAKATNAKAACDSARRETKVRSSSLPPARHSRSTPGVSLPLSCRSSWLRGGSSSTTPVSAPETSASPRRSTPSPISPVNSRASRRRRPGSEKGASMSLQLANLAMKCVKERVHSSRTRREMSSRPKMSRNE